MTANPSDVTQDRLFRGLSIAVVVPAYNEELLVKETLRGIPGYVSRVYAIDDCSTDKTAEAIEGLPDSRITLIRHDSNRGVGAAIVSGYKQALSDGMEIIAVMAGDNQMDPEKLHTLVSPIAEGRADYSKGNRLLNVELSAGMSSWRYFGNRLLTILTKISSGYWHVSDPQNGYTAISGNALAALDLDSMYTYYGYCNDLLIRLNSLRKRVVDVPIPARYGREVSKVRYGRFIARVSLMLLRGLLWRLVTKYIKREFKPLVLLYLAGLALLPLALTLGVLDVVAADFAVAQLYNQTLPSIMFLVGFGFLVVGILFDYLFDCSETGVEEAGHEGWVTGK